MHKSMMIGLVALAVGISAAAFAWRAYTPPQASQVTQASAPAAAAAPADAPAQVVADAPSSKGIFPKVLNH